VNLKTLMLEFHSYSADTWLAFQSLAIFAISNQEAHLESPSLSMCYYWHDQYSGNKTKAGISELLPDPALNTDSRMPDFMIMALKHSGDLAQWSSMTQKFRYGCIGAECPLEGLDRLDRCWMRKGWQIMCKALTSLCSICNCPTISG
jgi:hypothetical protein